MFDLNACAKYTGTNTTHAQASLVCAQVNAGLVCSSWFSPPTYQHTGTVRCGMCTKQRLQIAV